MTLGPLDTGSANPCPPYTLEGNTRWTKVSLFHQNDLDLRVSENQAVSEGPECPEHFIRALGSVLSLQDARE